MPEVNPQNLRWARETAALSVEQAARQIGLSGTSAAQRLREIEGGQRVPTRRNLVGMSKAYHRPLLALYVEQPPEKGERAHDLRTLHGSNATAEATLDAIVRDARVRQSILRDALEDQDEAGPIEQVGSLSPQLGPDTIAAAIVAATKFDLQVFRAQRTVEDAFSYARKAVESLGIFVLLIGDLGHHTRKVDPAVFRGISLTDPVVTFVVINDNDSKSAWTFTLFHELTHIFTGESAISGYGSDSIVERLCDDVASRVLLPIADLTSVSTGFDSLDQQVAEITRAARGWNVSRKMVTYNLLRTKRISVLLYQQLAARFDNDRLEFARRQSDGGDYFVVRVHRLGRSLIRTVDRMLASGALTAPKAGLVLGVKPTFVGRLTETAR